MLTRAEIQPWRNLAAGILGHAILEFVTDSDPPHPDAMRAVVFLYTGASDWLLDALDIDMQAARKDWLEKRKEFPRLLKYGSREEYLAWVDNYFSGQTRFYKWWEMERGELIDGDTEPLGSP